MAPASATVRVGGKGCLSDNQLPASSSPIDCPASAGRGRFKADTSQHPLPVQHADERMDFGQTRLEALQAAICLDPCLPITSPPFVPCRYLKTRLNTMCSQQVL